MDKLLPEFFRRLDDGPDQLFYAEPRRVSHIDEGALNKVLALYKKLLPPGGDVLDLMASYYSHLPEDRGRITGLGLNLTELRENTQIDEPLVHDINRAPSLPFADKRFCGAVCTASVQYMTQPAKVFAEVARVLKPGAPFIVTFSNRMFPTKAILAWRESDDAAHVRIVKSYFAQTPVFARPTTQSYKPAEGDPLYAVWAHKQSKAVAKLN